MWKGLDTNSDSQQEARRRSTQKQTDADGSSDRILPNRARTRACASGPERKAKHVCGLLPRSSLSGNAAQQAASANKDGSYAESLAPQRQISSGDSLCCLVRKFAICKVQVLPQLTQLASASSKDGFALLAQLRTPMYSISPADVIPMRHPR